MKKLLILAVAAAFVLPLNAQTDSTKNKSNSHKTTTPHKTTTKKKEDQADEGDNKPKTKAEKEKEKRDKEKQERDEKLKEQREKAKAKMEADKEARKQAAEKLKEKQAAQKEKQAAQKAGGQNKTGSSTSKTTHSTGKTTTNSKGKESKVSQKEEKEESTSKGGKKEITSVGGNVLTYYQQLPVENLPQLAEYIKDKNSEVSGAKVEDSKDLRKGFIRDQNLERGFLQLQLGVDMRYTRLQMYSDKKGEVFMAVETSNCESSNCNSDLKFYKKNGTEWQDVTETYIPKLDYKSMAKRLKDQYKKEYLDLDVYNSRGYENPETLKASITYNISPEETKILVKETYLPSVLYEMVWDEGKGKFDLKKK